MSRPLSSREEQILRLLAWGHTNKQISAQLALSVKTIEAHRYNGFRKVKCTNRVDLVRYALTIGWLKLEPPPGSIYCGEAGRSGSAAETGDDGNS